MNLSDFTIRLTAVTAVSIMLAQAVLAADWLPGIAPQASPGAGNVKLFWTAETGANSTIGNFWTNANIGIGTSDPNDHYKITAVNTKNEAHGIYGGSTKSGWGGVFIGMGSPNGGGIYAKTNTPGGLAGYFVGNVEATGSICDGSGNCVGNGSSSSTGSISGSWHVLVSANQEYYSWTNDNPSIAFVSITAGNSSKNSCSLSVNVDGLATYHEANNNTQNAKACGGFTIVPSGSTMEIISNPYRGDGTITAQAFY